MWRGARDGDDRSVPARATAVASALRAVVDDEAFGPLRDSLAALAVDDTALVELIGRVTHGPSTQTEVLGLRARVLDDVPPDPSASFEQYALVRAALTSVGRVAAQPVPDTVRHLLLDEFLWVADPPPQERHWMRAGEYIFSALCKLVTLRRFPAGQLHWETDGLPRSMLWRVRPRDLPRLLRGIGLLGGFRPAFVPHLAWRRPDDRLLEHEHRRSLLLMAEALRLQPDIRGVVAEAWYYSPATARVSPHLAWASRLVEESGGVLVVSGAASERSGVFARSRTRRRLAAEGRYRPTLGLGIWPRDRLIEWASSREVR